MDLINGSNKNKNKNKHKLIDWQHYNKIKERLDRKI